MENNYSILFRKLDEFIRKFYQNQLIRGVLLFTGLAVLFYILVNVIEYYSWLGITGRTILFYTYIFLNAAILFWWILRPLAGLFRLGKTLDYETAARIIGNHFTDVSDKLLNTLQLKEASDKSNKQNELLMASIEQRINNLQPVPFSTAIKFGENKKYLKYALPPLGILLIIIFAAPSLITKPTQRIIQHQEFFEQKAPFEFILINESLDAIQQEDYLVEVRVKGEEIPDEVRLMTSSTAYRMEKDGKMQFHYKFRNIQREQKFSFEGGGFRSREYTINVLPKPIVLNFDIELDYPAYTAKQDEILENIGDLVVPEGTNVRWRFFTRDTEQLLFRIHDNREAVKKGGNNMFALARNIRNSSLYSVISSNEYMRNSDSLSFAINVIKDVYPGIEIEEMADSLYSSQRYFKGFIKDDYGFSRLLFRYRWINLSDTLDLRNRMHDIPIPLPTKGNQQQFFHLFDLSTLMVQAGEEIEYYFEVWDNDAVNGAKSTRSRKLYFKVPSIEEIEEIAKEAGKDLKERMEESIEEAKNIQKEIDNLNQKLLDKKELGWQEKQQLEDLIERNKELQNSVEHIKEKQMENFMKENEFKEFDPEIIKKQQELEKLFDQIMTPEMKEMIKEMEEMLQKLQKDKVNEALEEMELSTEDLSKELDRNLELFKQLELEKEMSEAIDKLEELSEEQEKLAEESQNKESDPEELKKKQDELNKKFEKVREDIDRINELNKDLEDPNTLMETDQAEEDIQQDMQQSSEDLGKKKMKKAGSSQKSAGQKMKKLANDLQQMMDGMNAESQGEDIETLRAILENLIKVSFDQEELIEEVKNTKIHDPKYIQIIQEQKKLRDDLQIIEDSLFALSKRQTMIESIVNREINAINKNVDKTLEYLHNRLTRPAASKQQYVMTSVNNLALLLDEILQQMQQDMAQQQQQGNKSCNKPKGGKPKPGSGPSAKSMKSMQQQLNKQMEALKKQMESGKKPGKGQPGMSQQLARLAAKQEALRRMMQEYGNQWKDDPSQSGNISKMIQAMEQTETDIVNKMITNETLKRQEEILTRLLESEKAERQRELEKKRKSESAKNPKISNPEKIFEYKREKMREAELLKTVPPQLKPFYKNKVNDYFFNFED